MPKTTEPYFTGLLKSRDDERGLIAETTNFESQWPGKVLKQRIERKMQVALNMMIIGATTPEEQTDRNVAAGAYNALKDFSEEAFGLIDEIAQSREALDAKYSLVAAKQRIPVPLGAEIAA